MVLALAIGMVGPAAAAVRYEFTALSSFPAAYFEFGAPPETVTGSFTLEASNFITSNRSYAPAQLLSFSATGSLTGALTAGTQQFVLSPGFDSSIIFGFVGGPFSFEANAAYYFEETAFSAPGTYDTVLFGDDQKGRLVVTRIGDGGPGGVPEPASWAMLIAGFGLVGGTLRRQRHTSHAVKG
jgi:hypothetical protein